MLSLRLIDGDELKIRASEIVGWATSTPEGRRRYFEVEKSSEDEVRRIRQELGIFE